jgi:hypothetical protein
MESKYLLRGGNFILKNYIYDLRANTDYIRRCVQTSHYEDVNDR